MKRILTIAAIIISIGLHAQQTGVNASPKVLTATGVVRGVNEADK
jgi:hypothetical protein